ncbi:unnamed protein product [Cylicocyclus nassatus]|uniref:Uncharacterized protein n=1 Tax=Cylicocyclus nassatus TaxID=53992 RepID=A0AA36DLA0_CYLNA|nr:unnamed protein product [Cylicocyclus nassatus]
MIVLSRYELLSIPSFLGGVFYCFSTIHSGLQFLAYLILPQFRKKLRFRGMTEVSRTVQLQVSSSP